MSMLDHTLKPEPMRRLEVITGTGRRRRFSEDYKAGIVEETLVPGAVGVPIYPEHAYASSYFADLPHGNCSFLGVAGQPCGLAASRQKYKTLCDHDHSVTRGTEDRMRGDETPLGGPSVMLVQDQPRC